MDAQAPFPALRSMRVRLTLAHVAIFAVLQAALWLSIHTVLSRQLYARFDAKLMEQSEHMVALLEDAGRVHAGEDPSVWAREALAPSIKRGPAFHVSFPATQDSITSAGLPGLSIPPDVPQDRSTSPTFYTGRGSRKGGSAGPEAAARWLTVRREASSDGLPEFVLSLGTSLGPLHGALQTTQQLLLLFVVTSIVVVGVTSWMLGRRWFAPIGVIARKARRLTVNRLNERLPAPESNDEISEMVDVLNEMFDRLETQFKRQKQFIADVSHELKTPLSVLLAEAQSRRAEQNGFRERVQEQTRLMLRTVESFLLLTRATDGARALVLSRISIEDIVMAAVRNCRQEAQRASVRLVPLLHTSAGAAEPDIQGDTDLLRSALENLLHNAIRYSPPDQAVTIEVHEAGQNVEIEVRDRGPGVPPDQIGMIFDAFHQVASTTRAPGQCGIGLAIAKSVAAAHGGSIRVQNHDDGGALFTLSLPIDRPAVASARV